MTIEIEVERTLQAPNEKIKESVKDVAVAVSAEVLRIPDADDADGEIPMRDCAKR